jgi:MoaA/NifB/PqqE/SkfB family radical SAM enzyme
VDEAEVISKKLDSIGPQIISVGGGEPLLHKEIVPVVAALSRRHFTAMICNGWFVTPELARSLWKAGMYEISVSIDYADPKRHDAQRGVDGAHARGLAALEMLIKARVHPEQRVHMISVVMDDNLDEIEPLILLCRKMGITYLLTLYSTMRGAKESRQPSREVSAHLLELKQRYPEFVALRNYTGRITQALEEGGIGPCYAGRNLCNIDSQGNVTLCIDRLDDVLGNIFRDEPAKIERLLLEASSKNNCRQCWTSCRGAIETIMYGNGLATNLRDYLNMVQPIPLKSNAG